MKKPFNFGLFAIIALALPFALTHAQTTGVVAGATTATVAGPETPIADLPLTARKAKAEADLRTIQTQFSLFATRTQLTIDRLTVKNIDTTQAQTKLTASITALTAAKTNLDLLAKMPISDESPETDTTAIKLMLTKIQDNLKDARTNLIDSLTLLKTSVSLSIDAQQ